MHLATNTNEGPSFYYLSCAILNYRPLIPCHSNLDFQTAIPISRPAALDCAKLDSRPSISMPQHARYRSFLARGYRSILALTVIRHCKQYLPNNIKNNNSPALPSQSGAEANHVNWGVNTFLTAGSGSRGEGRRGE